jgi:hypothetical protein
MSMSSPSVVRRSIATKKTPPECLALLDNVCDIGAKCPEVQGNPIAQHALTRLQQATDAARKSLNEKLALGQALTTAIKTLDVDLTAVTEALRVYETAVGAVAKGNGAVINKAGLASRSRRSAPAALGEVADVTYQEGKHNGEAIVTWPTVPGANTYALEVNLTPDNPSGSWMALPPGGGRRRVVTTATRGAQALVRVAAIGNGNKQSAWSDPILVTTR